MNAALLGLAGLLWLFFHYRWFGRQVEQRLFAPLDRTPTPARQVHDGRDYVPTHPAVLFGHHFSSIAGAGPIVGPILAYALFGWLPALLWVLLGAVFLGGVHDYGALMTSLRHRGVSITEIAEKTVSPLAKALFAAFAWVALVLVQAVFAVLTARTLAEEPKIVLPTVGLLLLAVTFGLLVYRRGVNVWLATFLAVLLLLGLVVLGDLVPIRASYPFWLTASFLYAFVAATLPVWLLLQPRDYLSMYILVVGMVLGYAGLFLLRPNLNGPWLTQVTSSQGPLWPMLFITVACGAFSGFHSLVASGTTAKQLRYEREGRLIAYGGMLAEAALALLVIALMAGALYWGAAPHPSLAGFVFQDLLKGSANIAFGTGFGRAVATLGIPLNYGIAFGILMLNAFILTTLDTSTRIARYLVNENLGQRFAWARNRYLAAGAGLALAAWVATGNAWQKIWPAFGAANQLVGALALLVTTAFLVSVGKPKGYTLVGACFMLLTTEGALIYQLLFHYWPQGNWVLAGTA
ncbi:MAG: carbon starvation protein A, partial [Thermoanaerobaculum sp.]|nr:carbon starvation protein A [Thermoanaerobaculum sp.]MDW7967612.1 carbon starvation protein A [Thermoanaerobaculum sp.]